MLDLLSWLHVQGASAIRAHGRVVVLSPLSRHYGRCMMLEGDAKVRGTRLTLEELLASVFLEQRLMSDRSVEVVDEQLKDWSDLFLVVASKLCESLILDGC